MVRGEAVPTGLAGAASFGEVRGWLVLVLTLCGPACLPGSVQRVIGDGAVTLICAGWLPQEDVFGWRLPLV